jgi:hypothetical protein
MEEGAEGKHQAAKLRLGTIRLWYDGFPTLGKGRTSPWEVTISGKAGPV